MPSMPEHTQGNLRNEKLRWISYYMQKANFLPQKAFEILKLKKYAI